MAPTTRCLLRVAQAWQGTIHDDRVFVRPTQVSVGSDWPTTFVVPENVVLPVGFTLLRPVAGTYELSIRPGMDGSLHLGGQTLDLEELLAGGQEVSRTLEPGDWGIVSLGGDSEISFFFHLLPRVTEVGHGFQLDRRQVTTTGGVLALTLVLLAFSFSLSEPERKLDIRVGPQAQRFAKFVLQKPKPAEPPPEEDPRVKRLPSEGPHGPGQVRDPRAPRDQRTLAIERVERRGLLTFFRPGAGGADSLFTHDVGERLDQAMTGLSANAGSGGGEASAGGGGLGGGRGSGLVGQGGGFGSVYGTDVETRGSGSPRSSLSGRREHAVRTQVTPGAPSIDGFLSREQIDRVVRAHQRGIQYCYETELQRLPRLSGKVVVRFRIDLEGKVIKVDIDSSTLANAAVEGCVLRQIRRWQFPAPEGGHCIVAYPFLFSTGM